VTDFNLTNFGVDMKRTFLTIAIVAALSTGAYAGGNNNQNGPKFGGSGDSTAVAGAAAGAVAGAAAGANASNFNSNSIGVGVSNKVVGINGQSQSLRNSNTAVGYGGDAEQGQLQLQGQSSKQANAQSMTYNEAQQDYSDTYKEYAAPAYAPSIDPTVPCAIPLTGGITVPGVGGLAGGSAYIDKGCEIREMVRLGMQGDETSQRLANEVIQTELWNVLVEQSEETIDEEKEQQTTKAVGGYESIWDNPYL